MKSPLGALLKTRNRYGDTTTTPVPFVSAGPSHYVFNGLSGNTDSETYLRTYGTAGTIHAIVSLLSTSVARADWRLYRKARTDGRVRYTTGDQGSDQRTEVVQHAALNLWNHPNDFLTRHDLVETGQQHMELVGEQYWVVQRGGGMSFPTSMWPVRPDRMEPVPSAEKFLAGYVYTGPSGEKVPLQLGDVIQTKFPNPLDPYRGLGPVQSILTDIDAMKYGSEWNRNFFINSAEPGGIITVPGNLTDGQFNELSNRWRESHQGVARAHRVAMLENGMGWVDRKYSMKDMQFTELRAVSRDVLREAWGIHKAMLGNADDVNRANAQTAEEVFGRWQVIPRLERLKLTLNQKLLPMFGQTGENVEFDYVNPLPDDREADNFELTAKANAAAALVEAGFDADDVCEVVGLPPMKMAAVPPPPTPIVAPPVPGDNPDDTAGEPPQNHARPVITVTRPRNSAAAPTAPAHDLDAVDAQWKQAVAALAAAYAAQILPAQRQQLADQIVELVDEGDLTGLPSISADSDDAADLIVTALAALAASAARRAAEEAGQQGADVAPNSGDHATLKRVAVVTAALLAAQLALSAAAEAARRAAVAGEGDGADIAADVTAFLEGLSDASLTGRLAGALSAAQNGARIATFLGGPAADLFASEILDKATCGPCKAIDGEYLGNTALPGTVDAVEALYPGGGYIDCAGGDRCRGTIIAAYTSDTGSSDTGDVPLNTSADMLRLLTDLWHATPAVQAVNGHAKKAGV